MYLGVVWSSVSVILLYLANIAQPQYLAHSQGFIQ